MPAGKLTEHVAFEEPTPNPDGRGGTFEGWTRVFECRAGYTRLRGGEEVIASRLAGKQPTIIRVRSFANSREVKTDWRIVDTRTDEIFNIRSGPIISSDRLWLDFTADSGVAT